MEHRSYAANLPMRPLDRRVSEPAWTLAWQSSRCAHRVARAGVFLALVSGVAHPLGAQARTAAPPIGVQATKSIVWPAPPDQPRINLASVITSDRDLKREGGILSGFRRLIGGAPAVGVAVLRPHDVAVDSKGRLYVTCGIPAEVRLFDPATRESRSIGVSGDWRLSKPMGLAVDEHDNVYVADQGARRVLVFGPAGGFVRIYGGDGLFVNPVDVAIDTAADVVYVVDAFLHQVLAFRRDDGALIRRIGRNAAGARRQRTAADAPLTTPHGGGAKDSTDALAGGGHGRPAGPMDAADNRGTGPGQFRYPGFAAVGSGGLLYVSDGLNARVQVFDRAGKFVREIGRRGDGPGTFARPKGVALDSEGHLYVVDAAFGNVQLFDDHGRVLMAFAAGGRAPGNLLMPSGIASDRWDRLYVADRINDRVQVFTYLRALTTTGGPPDGRHR